MQRELQAKHVSDQESFRLRGTVDTETRIETVQKFPLQPR